MAQHGVIYNIPSEICQKISRKIDDSAKRSDDDGATTAARSLTAANDGSQCITCVPFLRINHFPAEPSKLITYTMGAGWPPGPVVAQCRERDS